MGDRPPYLQSGTPLGSHYAVEGLVRLSEGRMFYLANDVRPDLPERKCWACGHASTPRSATACASCGHPFKDRRFLVSARWTSQRFDAYLGFFDKSLSHPGLASPIDVFVEDGVLFSVLPYTGEGLMVDEASPLNNARLLDLGQRILGTLAYLHRHGVRLATLNRANLLVSPDNTVRLYDLEVEQTSPNGDAIPREHQAEVLCAVGELLRRYCDIEADALIDFLLGAEDGGVPDLTRFGREIESRFDVYAPVSYAPLLGGMSDVGLTRQLNEDNWGWVRLSDRAKLYVVADGMGGHDGGEVASALAVKTLCEVARRREVDAPQGEDAVENLLDESFQTANNTVKDAADAKGTDMGTTLVCMLVLDPILDTNGAGSPSGAVRNGEVPRNGAAPGISVRDGGPIGFVANVGDSRGYLLRNGVLHQITRDHSLVQKMVERGRITAEEARHHPHSNILLRTVGTERDIEIDIFRVELEAGDKVLMCSDGLWGEVEDRDMESILNTYSDPRIASRELVRAAHHGGGKDNVTLMIVTIP